MFSTDVLAVASIAGCTALSLGATAGLLSSHDRMGHDHACEVLVDDHSSSMTTFGLSSMTPFGGVIVVAPGESHEITFLADGDPQKCRRKRRRHRHRGEFERTRDVQRVLERTERARERAEQVRVRVMERRFEAESEAMAEAARSLEFVEGEMQDHFEAELRRIEMRESEMRDRVRRRVRRF